VIGAATVATVWWRGAGRELPVRGPRRPPLRFRAFGCAVWEFKSSSLASAEGDDAADRIVWGNAHGDSITRDDLDSEAAHPAAQLRQHFMPLVTLHAVKAAAMHRYHGALYVNQIVLAQKLSFQSKIVPHSGRHYQTQQPTHRSLDLCRQRFVLIAAQ